MGQAWLYSKKTWLPISGAIIIVPGIGRVEVKTFLLSANQAVLIIAELRNPRTVSGESQIVSLDPRPVNNGESPMNRRVFTASTLSAAVGLALALQAAPSQAQQMEKPQIVKDNMARAMAQHLEKCYGINAAAKNDCAEGAHSCAGQATQARDPKSFVLLPAGDCSKIQGGKTTAS